MGNYTKFEFHATLNYGNVPIEVIEYLEYRLTDNNELQQIPFCDHPFFKTSRWDWILTWDSSSVGSYKSIGGYFWDCDEGGFKISIDTILKNYDREIEWFLMWIAPYIETTEACMITKHYEECPVPEINNRDCRDLIEHIQAFIKENPDRIDPEISRCSYYHYEY